MRLIIADDHQMMIDGLLSILAHRPEITIVGVAKNGLQALAILEKEQIDIVLTDISMPEMDGLELTKHIHQTYPMIKVIALSMHGDTENISNMIEAGVSGYIYKNASHKELVDAIHKVSEGGQYFSDEIAGSILMAMNEGRRKKQEEQKVSLTDREKEIIHLIIRECSNAEIAAQLNISERTVESHRKNIYRKTDTTSAVGLVKWVYEKKAL